jgi:hypothetical protein
LILNASGEATYYYGPFTYALALHDANDVPQWVIDPVTGTGGGAASAGIGLGTNTVEVRPGVSTTVASAVVFPTQVLALGLTVWVKESLGVSQGLTHIGIGTPALPDCWGVLDSLGAETSSTAGLFLSYAGQPIPADGTVQLTAYGGAFDGAGSVYLTGHFATFAPSHLLGMSWTPPAPPSPSPPAPQLYATETEPGVIELATQTEVTVGADAVRAVTPLTLATTISAGTHLPTASETTRGILELASAGEVISGTAPLLAVTPAGLSARTATTTQTGLIELADSAETTTGTDATRAVTPAGLAAKVPSGAALSAARYAASGQALQATPLTVMSDTKFAFGTTTPLTVERTTLTAPTIDEVPVGIVATTGSLANQTPALKLFRRTSGVMADNFGVALSFLVGDSEAVDNILGHLTCKRQGADNSGRFTVRTANAGTLGSNTAPGDLAVDPVGNVSLNVDVLASGGTRVLALGQGTAPSTGPADAVQLWSANRGGVAGKNSLHLRVEDGTSHVLGDIAGHGTLCDATLGSGASYMALNVKGSQLFVAQSSTQERPQALIGSTWAVSTDATRQGRLTLNVYDAGAAREVIRMEADGSTAKLSFFAAAAVARPTVTGSRGANAALASALTALANLGLLTDSSTA